MTIEFAVSEFAHAHTVVRGRGYTSVSGLYSMHRLANFTSTLMVCLWLNGSIDHLLLSDFNARRIIDNAHGTSNVRLKILFALF